MDVWIVANPETAVTGLTAGIFVFGLGVGALVMWLAEWGLDRLEDARERRRKESYRGRHSVREDPSQYSEEDPPTRTELAWLNRKGIAWDGPVREDPYESAAALDGAAEEDWMRELVGDE